MDYPEEQASDQRNNDLKLAEPGNPPGLTVKLIQTFAADHTFVELEVTSEQWLSKYIRELLQPLFP